jgi:hypothetical protein
MALGYRFAGTSPSAHIGYFSAAIMHRSCIVPPDLSGLTAVAGVGCMRYMYSLARMHHGKLNPVKDIGVWFKTIQRESTVDVLLRRR